MTMMMMMMSSLHNGGTKVDDAIKKTNFPLSIERSLYPGVLIILLCLYGAKADVLELVYTFFSASRSTCDIYPKFC